MRVVGGWWSLLLSDVGGRNILTGWLAACVFVRFRKAIIMLGVVTVLVCCALSYCKSTCDRHKQRTLYLNVRLIDVLAKEEARRQQEGPKKFLGAMAGRFSIRSLQ